MRRTVLIIALLSILHPSYGASATTPTPPIQSLIESLGDPDPTTRQRAGEKLTAMGYTARPALVTAAQSGSPQVASRAAELLMKLPWWVLSDPPEIRAILLKYGTYDNLGRQGAITEIARTGGGEAALLRLVQEEPSDTVSWYAATVLRLIENDRINQMLRKMDLTDARVQVVALAARALLPVDRAKAIDLFHQAIEQDADDDGSEDAHLDFGYRVLLGDALAAGDIKGAADLRRLRAHRAVSSGDPSGAIFTLLAFYADHGPTDQMRDDIDEFGSYLGRPEAMYALARLEDDAADGSNLLKEALEQSALASTMLSMDTQLTVAAQLSERAWDHEARQLLYALLAMPEGRGDQSHAATQIEARLMLARNDEVIEDHAAVAEHLDAVLQLSEKPNAPLQVNLDGLRSQVAWHRLHAARQAGDKQTAEKLLGDLSDLTTPDSDVAIEVVTDLKSLGRTDEAKAYFDKAYRLQSAPLKAQFKGAEVLNNLAWLCARCGEHANEAVSLAERAMALEPEHYMYLDTAASAQFAAGNPAEAVRLEQRAVNMRPADAFMRRQLALFGAAANKDKP